MKFFIAFVALVAVASASPIFKPVTAIASQLHAIVAAIHNPNTEPATAHLLEHLLEHIIAALPSPVAVGPAPIEQDPVSVGPAIIEQDPISVGPVFIDHEPVSVGPAIIEENPVSPVQPSPVVIGPIAPGSPAPLVQIIVNIKSADNAGPATPVRPEGPVDSVIVVDEAEEPVDPVGVVDESPVPVEPVIVGNPVFPEPAITLPEELN